jgi:hypothetical protein
VSKYDPLRRYLKSRTTEQSPMTFADVERVLGFALPLSARVHPTWWSNNTGTHVGVRAWRDAGWRTSRVDVPGERVVFVRDPTFSPSPAAPAMLEVAEASPSATVVTLRLDDLSPAAEALVKRDMAERGVSADVAIGDLLHQVAIDRRRRLLERFPLEGPRSKVDSVELIREERDAR